MPYDPRFVKGYERTPEGLRIKLRCPQCGELVTILIRASDPEESAYPLGCSCGAEAHLVTTGGLTGRALLDAAENAPRVPVNLEQRCPPSLN